jgi:PAS domain-containing protein
LQTKLDSQTGGGTVRTSISVADSQRGVWFDVTKVEHGDAGLFYATEINAVVNAEIAQRNFVQTLAKTFAHLSIGLAIFDRNRQLALFNPALIDLTALPADFLSARPDLLSFFDRLRDNRMMPEPKNYASWRLQMTELQEAAADGRYQETWSLPSGSVYSVSGRPHPDGAVAFLIEDITAEVTLTRRFRSELELGQSVLDQLDDAIAVFSSGGVLTLSNNSYRQMWGVDPDGSFVEMTVLDATRDWQNACQATPVWGDLRDFVWRQELRAEWWGQIALNDGSPMTCWVHPIQGGATLVRFIRQTGSAVTKPAVTQDGALTRG